METSYSPKIEDLVALVQSKGHELTVRELVEWFLTHANGTIANAIALREEEVVLIDLRETKRDQERQGGPEVITKGYSSLFWSYLFFAIYGYVHIIENKQSGARASQRVMEIMRALQT